MDVYGTQITILTGDYRPHISDAGAAPHVFPAAAAGPRPIPGAQCGAEASAALGAGRGARENRGPAVFWVKRCENHRKTIGKGVKM